MSSLSDMALPSDVKIILGSSSSTRRAILKEMGFVFDVVTADIDESSIRREKPEDLVMALAEAKAQAILAKLAAAPATDYSQNAKRTLLITADQVVVHEGNIREKPRTVEEARLFIEGYSRSPANTVGAVLVTNLTTGARKGGVDRTEIYFHPIPDHVIDTLVSAYLQNKEVLHALRHLVGWATNINYGLPAKLALLLGMIEEGSVFWAAGGLLVEHPLVSPLVNAMVGSIDSVMGLPKELTTTLINEALEISN